MRDAASATLRYCRVMFFRLREASETVAPFLTASARYPSHLTSYDQSAPLGRDRASVAIIGGIALAKRGKAGRLPTLLPFGLGFLPFCCSAVLPRHVQR